MAPSGVLEEEEKKYGGLTKKKNSSSIHHWQNKTKVYLVRGTLLRPLQKTYVLSYINALRVKTR